MVQLAGALWVRAVAGCIGNAGRRLLWLNLPLALALLAGCKALSPSNDRDWNLDQSVLPYAAIRDEGATIYNIRHCKYFTTEDYALEHYNKTIRWADVQSVDYIVVPFAHFPSLAHTMLSFGFADGTYLAVSVEIRKEKGETYKPLQGLLRQYEIMYVLGDERDLIALRTNFRRDDVYVYRVKATPEQVQALLADVLHRVNQLQSQPEFYNTLTNNCTTNIVDHINRLSTNKVTYDLRVLLPGLSDRLAYDMGLIEARGTFEQTKLAARVTHLARAHGDSPQFSQLIRRQVFDEPPPAIVAQSPGR